MWYKNPQFLFMIKSTTMITIDLQQPDPRCLYENKPPFRKMQIVLVLFKLDATEKSVAMYDPQKVVWMKGADSHAIDIGGELKPGKYAVVCMTSKEGEYADCYISVYYECPPADIIFEVKDWDVITEEEGDEDGEESLIKPEPKSGTKGLLPPIKSQHFTDIVKNKVELRDHQRGTVKGLLRTAIQPQPKKQAKKPESGYKWVNFTAFGKVYHKQIPIGAEAPGVTTKKLSRMELGAAEEDHEVPAVKDAMGLEVQL